ncbi:phage tail protein [Cardiobacteriaceae bacterium TAE3-ERU3]|nr:phage tail protein [Cardiobacteriaceae bacterium TAE3-ERU3]
MDTFNWKVDLAGAGRKSAKAARVVKFGDGYEQRQADGIAPPLKTWSVTKTAKKAEADEIEAFLLRHTVTPFYWQPDDVDGKYVLDEGGVQRSFLGAGWCRLSWTAREVRA